MASLKKQHRQRSNTAVEKPTLQGSSPSLNLDSVLATNASNAEEKTHSAMLDKSAASGNNAVNAECENNAKSDHDAESENCAENENGVMFLAQSNTSTQSSPLAQNTPAEPSNPLEQSTTVSQCEDTASAKASKNKQAQIPAKDPWQDEDENWGISVNGDTKLKEKVIAIAENAQAQRTLMLALPVFMLTLVFLCSGFGIFKGAMLMQEIAATTDSTMLEILHEDLLANAGAFANLEAIGCGIWYGLSSLAGGISLLLPVWFFYRIGRRNIKSTMAGLAVFDLVKAEVLKYCMLIVLFGYFFKFTTLVDAVLILSFAVMNLLDIVLRVWLMPKPDQELQEYLKRQAAANRERKNS